MGYTIKHFNKEERKAFFKKHDLLEPKEWAIVKGPLVMGFFDSKEEAGEFLADLVKAGKATDSPENLVAEAETNIPGLIREFLQKNLNS